MKLAHIQRLKVTGPSNGFTLIELLVVIAIVAVLATIGLPLTELTKQRAKEEDLRRSLREIRHALDAYKQLSDEGRIERIVDGSGYPPNLNVLVDGVKDARSPDGRRIFLLRSLPADPMERDVAIGPAESWSLRSYASPPEDPRPGKDVFDIHSRSQSVGLDGTPYRTW